MATVIDSVTKTLGLAGSITTVLALAALSILAAYLIGAQWLRSKGSAAKSAIDKGDNEALARLLGGTAVPLDELAAEQKYALATEELRTRAKQRSVAHALIFFAFLAVLGFALVLALAPSRADSDGQDNSVQLDLLGALNVLRYVPTSERQAVCATLMPREDCTRAAPMIGGLTYQQPTLEQENLIEDAVSRGSITGAEARELMPCGGAFNFRVVNNMLTCADGRPLPEIAVASGGRPMLAREAIVLHASVTSRNVSFPALANLIANGSSFRPGPLAHLLISRTGAIAQVAPFNRVAYHVGRGAPWRNVNVGNSNSIGIELIHSGNYATDPWPRVQLDATEAVVRALMREYEIRAVVGHSEIVPHKTDPGPGVAAAIRQAVGLSAG